MTIKKDYLHGTNIEIIQRKDMFRMNTDSRLLGEYLKVNSEQRLLDIGCNNGVVMLYASCFNPKEIVGVDIFEEAIQLAKQNLEDNNIFNYKLYKCDINDFNTDTFDVIVCNPPYFNTSINGNLNQNEFMHRARHEDSLNLETLFNCVARLLNKNGTFHLVHRASRIEDIIYNGKLNGLKCTNITFVFDENKQDAVTVLTTHTNGRSKDLNVSPNIYITR